MQGFQIFIVSRTSMTGEEPSMTSSVQLGLWLVASGEQMLPRKSTLEETRCHIENMQKAKG